MKLKRTEITVEVDELIQVTADPRWLVQAWCSACGTEATLVTPAQAAVAAGVSVRTINQWVESDRVHFIETEDGLLLICVSSLERGIR